uniref:ATP-dependent DNA helicase 2 subunit KU70 n=1 Tax=Rhizophora mucronata TaxID=61149 RepID=A0A2P2J750_RHIMU
MEAVDPDDIFKDDEDDSDGDDFSQREATKELAVYLVDASPKMFTATCSADGEKKETHFHVAVSCIAEALKTQIINRSYDEVAICFFNTHTLFWQSPVSI